MKELDEIRKELLNIYGGLMAKVLNLKDTNYKIPEGAIYVGRASPRHHLPASKWGNPFRIGIDGTRIKVIEKYRMRIINILQFTDSHFLDELRGKDLVCWCHNWDGQGINPMFCHADILLELANK